MRTNGVDVRLGAFARSLPRGHAVRMVAPVSEVAELLTQPGNYAVVQLPGREVPGVVFQGDSLSVLYQQAVRIADLARGTAAQDEAADLRKQLDAVVRRYVAVLEPRGIEPPFTF